MIRQTKSERASSVPRKTRQGYMARSQAKATKRHAVVRSLRQEGSLYGGASRDPMRPSNGGSPVRDDANESNPRC
nr:hypothetical protein CFP56_32125 [Quercus suber]